VRWSFCSGEDWSKRAFFPQAMKTPKYQVYNKTDDLLASPLKMSFEEATRFIDEFRKRFVNQGFYLTTKGKSIAPKEIELEIKKV